MSRELSFWDSSALVPLCVNQFTSRRSHVYLRRFTPVVWWGSTVEISSAIARLHRSGELSHTEKIGAITRLDFLSQGWKEILPSESLRNLARGMVETYEIRAADGFQLAAALTWCRERPKKKAFISADKRLSNAASAAGFSTIELT